MSSMFDQAPERRGTGSYKWDHDMPEGTLPLWVADMDFRVAEPIMDALRRRVEHGVFGYTAVGQEYYGAVTGWFARRHGWNINPAHIIYTIGVVPAVSAIIKAVCAPGDKVILQTPAYNCFFSSIRNNDCELAANPLIRHADGSYSIDFDGLEALASDPRAKVMILCNPHNPTGRVWTPEELRRVGEICFRNDVLVLSDDIHCELVYPGHRYTPFASLGAEFAQKSVTCISASKAFNIAGLQIANIVADDRLLRARIDKAININEVCDVNPFGVAATIAAYNESEPWLTGLIEYLAQNRREALDFFRTRLPEYPVTDPQATYLLWIDCRAAGLSSGKIVERLEQEARVLLSPGEIYHGEGFIRLNMACPRERLREALRRIEPVLKSLVLSRL